MPGSAAALHTGLDQESLAQGKELEFWPEKDPCQHHLLQGCLPSVCTLPTSRGNTKSSKLGFIPSLPEDHLQQFWGLFHELGAKSKNQQGREPKSYCMQSFIS